MGTLPELNRCPLGMTITSVTCDLRKFPLWSYVLLCSNVPSAFCRYILHSYSGQHLGYSRLASVGGTALHAPFNAVGTLQLCTVLYYWNFIFRIGIIYSYLSSHNCSVPRHWTRTHWPGRVKTSPTYNSRPFTVSLQNSGL